MWILLITIIPFVDAFGNLFNKRSSLVGVKPVLISWANNVVVVVLVILLSGFIHFKLTASYFMALSVTGTINILATILYMNAVSKGDISEVIPMLSFTPLFMLITSPVIVGEFPKPGGIAGILLVVTGSYLLNINLRKRNFIDPVKALFRNAGTRMMLFVSFLYSITSNFDKLAVNSSSPLQHLLFLNLYVFLGVTLVVIMRKSFDLEQIIKGRKSLFMLSLLNLLGSLLFLLAITYTYVAYVIALKRTSGMLSVLMGHFFLAEANVRERLLGAFIMFMGVLLILLG
ncbi:MAG: EamA family transporter [Ignavibacteria bacterium]|nr:EamA family transporter [Ignavibacteria bacterium]MCU7501594.1 EamA family transporter [Ignavibacteria bacterium]MCU7517131.1 EamA family transporter [Ignavibacteria bacterium]